MNSPVLRLSADVWTPITNYLAYEDIKNLIITGSSSLSQLVGLGTEAFVANKRYHAVDLECILHTARATPNLKELSVNPIDSSTQAMKPLLPLQASDFPRKLTSLIANFTDSIYFFLVSHRIDTLAPNLITLALRGSSSPLRLKVMSFPPNLQTLKLDGEVLTKQGDISRLPRSLTTIAFSAASVLLSPESDWPSELSSLSIDKLEFPVLLERLPRTLTHLSVASAMSFECITTSFETSNKEHFNFPWRCFFPSLTSLSIDTTNDLPLTLKSMVSPNAHDASEVSTFSIDTVREALAPSCLLRVTRCLRASNCCVRLLGSSTLTQKSLLFW